MEDPTYAASLEETGYALQVNILAEPARLFYRREARILPITAKPPGPDIGWPSAASCFAHMSLFFSSLCAQLAPLVMLPGVSFDLKF